VEINAYVVLKEVPEKRKNNSSVNNYIPSYFAINVASVKTF
jgi:hypothetical protein